jgi:hypothetical protein
VNSEEAARARVRCMRRCRRGGAERGRQRRRDLEYCGQEPAQRADARRAFYGASEHKTRDGGSAGARGRARVFYIERLHQRGRRRLVIRRPAGASPCARVHSPWSSARTRAADARPFPVKAHIRLSGDDAPSSEREQGGGRLFPLLVLNHVIYCIPCDASMHSV